MSYLLYCIVDGERREPRRRVCSLGYPRASIAVRAGGLGAVASPAAPADLAPDVARLLAYARVVDCYNRERTVIPMRYGCTVGELEEARALLERRRHEYLRLLTELDGRIEMSVRVVASEESSARAAGEAETAAPLAHLAGADSGGPGIAYLARRGEYYARRAGLDRQSDELRRRVCAAAEGTFVHCAGDFSEHGRGRTFAMHFLVARAALRRFRQALAPLCAASQGVVTLTGPWPPYNFVWPSMTGAPRPRAAHR